MRLSFGDNADPNSMASRMRRARVAQFLALIPNAAVGVSVLDVGGNEAFWAKIWSEQFTGVFVTLLNLTQETISGKLPIISLAGDARDLSRFKDKEFDFCFSNSVIEHVGTLADQNRMACEIRRVAKGYFIQTPYRYFVLEPHFHFPIWPVLPLWLRTALHRRFNLGYVVAERDYLAARIEIEQIRLLSCREYHELFPDGNIRREKIGPLVKSLIAVRKAY